MYLPPIPSSSAGKESACNAGDLGSIPGLGEICCRRERLPTPVFLGFPGGSASKESTRSAGDLGSIPRLGRSPGEEIGYSLQYSWASLVAQTVKDPHAMQETWVQSLGWEDSLEKAMPPLPFTSTPVFWPGEFHGLYSPRGHKESEATEQLSLKIESVFRKVKT